MPARDAQPRAREDRGARDREPRYWAALARAGHPGPALAISALTAVLAAQAAPRGAGPVALVVPAVTAGQFSIGWSNDYFDAGRDAAAGRADKPVVTGAVSRAAAGAAGAAALLASLGFSLAIGVACLAVNSAMMAAGWAYNAGLKATWASGLMYLAGFGLIPAFAASTLPGHPAPRPLVTTAAAVLGLGAHFANVLPDLDGDRAAGVRGLPQRVAARYGPLAVRLCALVLLLSASGLLALAAPRKAVALGGLAVAAVLAVAGAASPGRLPFLAAIGIAVADVALFVFGGVILV